MAILMDTELYSCTNCGCLEFEVNTYKSFAVGQKVNDHILLGENTTRKVMKCIKCHVEYDPKELNLILKEIEE